MLTVSYNFSFTCILQKCHFCQNESCQNKHSLNIFPKTILLLLWQQPLFSPSVSVSNRSSQAGLIERGHGERKDWCSQLQQVLGWGWGWPDAITDWPRGEKASQLLQTQTFSTIGPRTMTAIYVGLNCLVYTSNREERDHWASLTDHFPYPHYEGVGWLMLSSFPGFLLWNGCSVGRRKATTSSLYFSAYI